MQNDISSVRAMGRSLTTGLTFSSFLILSLLPLSISKNRMEAHGLTSAAYESPRVPASNGSKDKDGKGSKDGNQNGKADSAGADSRPSLSEAANEVDTPAANIKVPALRDIPRLTADTPEGTIAWATIDQLHPTQPQVGGREVERKVVSLKKLKQRLTPDKFYEFLYLNRQVPVFIGPVPPSDTRSGKYKGLAYPTDRHHAASAITTLETELMSTDPVGRRDALSEPILVDGLPTNFVLVKVVGNKMTEGPTPPTFAEFAKFMTEPGRNRVYLQDWKPGTGGLPAINEIPFENLPSRIWEMTDNPWRSATGLLKLSLPGLYGTDFAQFKTAEYLVSKGFLKYEDIGPEATFKTYVKSIRAARKHLAEIIRDRLKSAQSEFEQKKEQVKASSTGTPESEVIAQELKILETEITELLGLTQLNREAREKHRTILRQQENSRSGGKKKDDGKKDDHKDSNKDGKDGKDGNGKKNDDGKKDGDAKHGGGTKDGGDGGKHSKSAPLGAPVRCEGLFKKIN